MLLGCYRKGDANDPEVYVRAVAAVLGDYPEDVARTVCDPRRGIPSRSDWLPTVAEVKAACEAEMAPVYRRERETKLAEERQQRIAAVERPYVPLDIAAYGDNWGLSADRDGKKRWQPKPLDELCREAGVDREEFEAINTKAVEARQRSGAR